MLPVPLMFNIPFKKTEEIGGRLLFVGMNTVKWAHQMRPLVLRGSKDYIRLNTYTCEKQLIGFTLRDMDLTILTDMNVAGIAELVKVMECDTRIKVLLNQNGWRSVMRWEVPSE